MSVTRSVTCPSCGGGIEVKAAGYSVSVACQYCGSVLDVTNPDVKLIEEYHLAAMNLAIPLGTRGVLYGVEWEAIGYLGRSDGEESWDEFLLFNPYAGYRWLTQADGEWQFGTMLMDEPQGSDASVRWRGSTYEADYAAATTTTERVVGEFYWRVRAGDQVQAMTFSNDSQQLSVEWNSDETNWTVLVDVPAAVIEAGFKVQPVSGLMGGGFGRRNSSAYAPAGSSEDLTTMMNRLREQSGERIALPGGFADYLTMAKIGAGAIGLIVVIMIVFGLSTGSVHQTFDVVIDGAEKNQTVGTLALGKPYQFVTVTARTSDFTNRWVDLDYSLVNRQTQQSIDASGTVEYYRGHDSDGDWSEGSHSTTTKFAGVPGGTYDIVVDASAHTWTEGSSSYSSSSYNTSTGTWGGGEKINVQIDAKSGGFPWSNLFMTIFAMLGLPGLFAWLRSKV